MPDAPDDSRSAPEQNARPVTKAEGVGASAATGLGCLTFATLPFSILVLVGIILGLAWLIHRMITTYSP